MADAIVLDNVVLSAFHHTGWFDCLEHWCDEYDVLAPAALWHREFAACRDIGDSPDWLELHDIQSKVETEYPGALSDNDWRCLITAEERNGIVVTRDRKLRKEAKARSIDALWLGKFVIQTYESCGISVSQYDAQLEEYLSDSYAPKPVKDALRAAEKAV